MEQLVGSKSFLALDRGATFTCRKNGKEYKYYAYQGSEFCEYDLIHEIDTDQEDGVIFELPLKGFGEKSTFIAKAKQKLAYYDTAILMTDEVLIENKINRHTDFQWSTLNSNGSLHLCLKDVYYPLDFEKLGIQQIYLPIALRFHLKDGLIVTPSREQLIYTDKVKDLILNKIRSTADYFVEKYNETVQGFNSFIEAYPHIKADNRNITVGGKDFTIDSIVPHASVIPATPHVTYMSPSSPEFYKEKIDMFNKMYEYVGYMTYSNTRVKTKKIYRAVKLIISDYLSSKLTDTFVLISGNFTGNLREYLKQKYKSKTYFLRERPLDLEWYKDELKLRSCKKEKWREHIVECQSVYSEIKFRFFIDETDVVDTKEFKDWVEQKKLQMRLSRTSSGSYQVLDKQKDEMTISIARASAKKGDIGVCVLRKRVFKINELYKQSHLFVVFKDEAEAKDYWSMFSKSSHIKVCTIGNKEIKKLPNLHNFIKFEEFMTRDCKPFQRIASSILFEKVVKDFDLLKARSGEIFTQYLSSYIPDRDILEEYVSNNIDDPSDTVKAAILEIAEEKDLFDKQHWDIYMKIKEIVGKYQFLTCLKSPSVYDVENTRKYNSIVNKLLLFQKKKYSDLEDYELVKKDTKKVLVLEKHEDDEDDEYFDEDDQI